MFDLLDEVKDGFKFKCIECGRCCTGKGEGFVYVFEKEIKRMSKFLKIKPEEFIRKYTEEIDAEFRVFNRLYKPTKRKVYLKTPVLIQDKEDGSCIFLDTNLCKIYEVRPTQCRTWPCWHVIVTNRRQYENAIQKCPGINTEGGMFISSEEINKVLKQEINTEQKSIKKNKKR